VLFLAFILVPLNALLVWASAHQQGYSKVVLAQLPSMVILPISFLCFLGVSAVGVVPASQFRPTFVLLIQLLATAVALGGALLFLRQTLGITIKKHVTPTYEIRRWIGSASRLVLVDSMYLLTMNVDILMLGSMAGAEEAGVYKIATRGADLIVYTLFIVSIPLAPIIARLYAAHDYERLQRAITKTTRVACLVAIPVALLLVFFGEWFLALFGEGFVEGKPVLIILAFSQLFNAVTGPVGRLLVMAGHEGRAARAVSIGAVTNVILNALLIPDFGIKGAATATALSTVLWNGIMVWDVWSRLRLDPTMLGWKSTASLARP
jgi:O-antigen/teichoic acid export membrane protein